MDDVCEQYGLAWVEFRDPDTRRYLGKLNVTTGVLVLPQRGRECRFDVSDAIKSIMQEGPASSAVKTR